MAVVHQSDECLLQLHGHLFLQDWFASQTRPMFEGDGDDDDGDDGDYDYAPAA